MSIPQAVRPSTSDGANIVNYGATLNDATDDWQAYTNAIAAIVSQNGGYVVHPTNGTRSARLSNPLIVPEGVVIRGVGSHASGTTAASRLAAHPTFPWTQINGNQTLPASPATAFTLNVKGGNGTVSGTDGVMSTGVGHSFTSASATFTAGLVGKTITVTGAGPAGSDLVTTVTARGSNTQLTLAAAASTAVTGAAYVIGHPTDKFPLGLGGSALTGGIGVLCVQGVTIHYTGVTGSTFTGCTTNDVGATLNDGRNVGTFLVWLGEPGVVNTAEGTRLEHVRVDGSQQPGISGIHSSRIAEGSGLFDVQVGTYKIFGIRVENAPRADGTAQNAPANWEMRKLDMEMTQNCEAEAVAIDLFGSGLRADGSTHVQPSMLKFRGVKDVSVSGTQSTTLGRAAVRVNGYTGGTMQDIDVEGPHGAGTVAGILLGDKLTTKLTVISASASRDMDGPVVRIGPCAIPCSIIGIARSNNVNQSLVLVDDQINGHQPQDQQLGHYIIGKDGSVSTDSPSVGRTVPIATKAGIPSDADYTVPPPVGTPVLDTTNHKLWYRFGAADWRGVVLA